MPERYSDTRWLGVYDVAVDTLRLMDAYTLFFYPFLQPLDRVHDLHICVEIYKWHNLDDRARDAVRSIQGKLRAKKMTAEGKEEKKSNSGTATFLEVKAAYVATGLNLQKKMPVNNKLLKHLSSLDPVVRGQTEAMQYMKALPDLATNVLSEEDLLEVQRFHTDSTLPLALLDMQLDTWWALVFRTGKFPALRKMVAALLSCFHGPQVEGSFSVMGNVITTKTACLGIKTPPPFRV